MPVPVSARWGTDCSGDCRESSRYLTHCIRKTRQIVSRNLNTSIVRDEQVQVSLAGHTLARVWPARLYRYRCGISTFETYTIETTKELDVRPYQQRLST